MPDNSQKPDWSNVNLSSEEQLRKLHDNEDQKAGERVKAAVKNLKQRGILDEYGRRVKKGLPPDMQEGAPTDFGG